jgi:DNA-binding phage protein
MSTDETIEKIIKDLSNLYDTPEKCWENREKLEKFMDDFIKQILNDEKNFIIENEEDIKRVAAISNLIEKINIYRETKH